MAARKLAWEKLPHSVELTCGEPGSGRGLAFAYVDERLLPGELKIARTRDWRAVVDAVKSLAVRGAPAIGLAGASALALWADAAFDEARLAEVAECIASARPTAVNLRWAVDRALSALEGVAAGSEGEVLFELVTRMQAEDEAANRAMGAHGAALLGEGSRVLTHCNAGSLGTYYFGTALGVVYAAAEQGKIERVYADETRPVGQGARLTAWELSQVGVPVTLICDNMAASLMAQGLVDAVVVGADRIAANGDVANKIGTYGVAVLARAHGIPFYVVAPTSTIDMSLPDGSGIVIEQRSPAEVLPVAIEGVDVINPAFDVTPASYVTRIVTELGVFEPADLSRALASARPL